MKIKNINIYLVLLLFFSSVQVVSSDNEKRQLQEEKLTRLVTTAFFPVSAFVCMVIGEFMYDIKGENNWCPLVVVEPQLKKSQWCLDDKSFANSENGLSI